MMLGKPIGARFTATAASVEGPANMQCLTTIVGFHEQPDRNRVAVMFFGRPALYYAPADDRQMVDRLRKSHAQGTPVQVEWDPQKLEILRVDPAT